MGVPVADQRAQASRPPRAMAWVLILSSAGAVAGVGLFATAVLFSSVGAWPTPPAAFWPRLLVACGLTVVSLSLRSVRWMFLLRRTDTRIPIRDAYIGYLSGLTLLVTPLLLGEIAIRAWILRARGRVPILTTAVVNVWERVLDFAALAIIAALATFAAGSRDPWIAFVLGGSALLFLPVFRRLLLMTIVTVAVWGTRTVSPGEKPDFGRLATSASWLTALAASILVWALPGLGLWVLASGWGSDFGVLAAERAYARSATLGAAQLAPAGVLIAGPDMLAALARHGVPDALAVLTVFGIRLATAGVSIALGVVFLVIHAWTSRPDRFAHFDDIADAYDVQIPEARRRALLERKTALMRGIIEAKGSGRKGLDVGCGQGAYVGRMRELGFDVAGIDSSAGQIRKAAGNLAAPDLVQLGSVLDIPAADESFDFVYAINVLHHLGSLDDQRRAFGELARVLKPGGLLFVHEINTRNVLFRFYMGYVFPSLNCIDEGVERWLLPHRLAQYTDLPVVDVEYFTFFPDFMPQAVAGALSPVERLLESSPLRVYSAHYMATLRKEGRNGGTGGNGRTGGGGAPAPVQKKKGSAVLHD
jgi:ubiquinone/menaquinone biosynthesis C-methylase UbiE